MTAEFPPKRILTPIDFSEPSHNGLIYATELAAAVGAKVVVLHVGPPIPDFSFPLPESTALQAAAWTGDMRARRQAAEEAIEKQLEPFNTMVEFEIRFEEGETVNAVVETAKDANCDLIVMGSHGRTGFRRALLGSVAERVARVASVPVLIAR